MNRTLTHLSFALLASAATTFAQPVPVLAQAHVATGGPAGAAASAPVDDDGPDPLVWRWRRHHWADYVATGVFGATAFVTEVVVPHGDEPRWLSGNRFDDSIRDAFGLHNYSGRSAASTLSDITLVALVTQRVLIDDVLVSWVGQRSAAAAWQMAALDAQAMMFTLAVTGGAKRAFERERPSGRACRTDASYDRRCVDQSRDGSFFSGHTSLAFTTAALTCMHHLHLPIYGGDGDTVGCVAAALLATSVGFERILADRHYASDVLVGAALGAVSGGLLPWVSFYARPAAEMTAWSIAPTLSAHAAGVSVQGVVR